MVEQPAKSLEDLVEHVGRYPEQAFLFVREGLSYAAEKVHGLETEAHRHLQLYLAEKKMYWNDIIAQYHAGQLPRRWSRRLKLRVDARNSTAMSAALSCVMACGITP